MLSSSHRTFFFPVCLFRFCLFASFSASLASVCLCYSRAVLLLVRFGAALLLQKNEKKEKKNSSPPLLLLLLEVTADRQALTKKKEKGITLSSFSLSLTRSAQRFSRLRDAAASAERRRSAAAARRRAAPAADDAAGAAAWSFDAIIVRSPPPPAAVAPAAAAARGLPPAGWRRGLFRGAAARSEAPDTRVSRYQGEIVDDEIWPISRSFALSLSRSLSSLNLDDIKIQPEKNSAASSRSRPPCSPRSTPPT